ncbi:hypothetical protein M0R72_09035 [Candidatus Pacearchaeota archaeon]|jgi:hypothetical protein|nr:hypothetical protein [Candidatus Pacearchaeota archaeon]
MNELTNQQPADLAALDYGDMAHLGYENTGRDDMLIPFLAALQALSPQVQAGTPDYIEGAKTGDLYNTATKAVVDGRTGLLFIPCTTQHVFTEWVPRDSGGGFVGQHAADSAVVLAAKAASTKFGKYKHQTEKGENDLVETFYLFGLTVEEDLTNPQPAVIAITSTKIKPYKQLVTALRTCKVRAPLFANVVRIRTAIDKNPKGTFANYVFTPAKGGVIESLLPPVVDGRVNPLLEAGKKLAEEINAGRAQVDQRQAGDHASEDDEPAF